MARAWKARLIKGRLVPWPPTERQQRRSLAEAFHVLHGRYPVDASVVDYMLGQMLLAKNKKKGRP